MAKIKQKERAQSLRKQGLSIGEIAHDLVESKSTISYWCRDIVLTNTQLLRLKNKQKEFGMKTILEHVEQLRRKRLLNTEKAKKIGRNDVGVLSERDFFMVGLALYWGEGYKKGNDEVGFTNSNPFIIKSILRWFKKHYHILERDFILRISINQIHKQRIEEILTHWSRLTGIPESQFTKTSFIKTKSKKIYLNPQEHFGTLRVKVRRGTSLRRRILGSLEILERYSESGKKLRNKV